jgi:hypothetical protein
MANIQEAREAAVDFLKKTLNVEEVHVIKITKSDNGWFTEAEVYEESSFMKSLGLPTRMQDRNMYTVKLNNNLEVESYERLQEHALMSE